MDLAPGRPAPSPTWLRVLRAIGITIVWSILALLTLWAVAALYVDFRIAALRIPVTVIYVRWDYRDFIQVQTIPLGCRPCVLAGFCCVLAWWLTLKPSNDGQLATRR